MSPIAPYADSVIEILAAQCADLEALLVLARQETSAVEKQDFEKLFEITRQRATLGERLEIYHRQIVDMRAKLGVTIEPLGRNENAMRAAALVMEIHSQDAHTRPLLLAARSGLADQTSRLDHTHRHLNAYLRQDKEASSIACDQRV